MDLPVLLLEVLTDLIVYFSAFSFMVAVMSRNIWLILLTGFFLLFARFYDRSIQKKLILNENKPKC